MTTNNPTIMEKIRNAKVEWKTLGEVCDFQNGFAFKSSLFKESGIPIIRIGNIYERNVDLSDLKYFSIDDYKENLENFKVSKGDIVIAMSGATTGKIGYYDNEIDAYINQRVGKFDPKQGILDNRYLFHFLSSKMHDIYLLAGGGAQPNLSSTKLLKDLKIPIPPLALQQEIASILDKFTALNTELCSALKTELSLRQKQYHYYREKLLTFDDKVEWKTLGEVGEVRMCKRILKNQTSESGDIPFYKIGTFGKQPNAYISRKLFEEYKAKYPYPKIGEVLISASGTIGKTVIFDGKDAYFQDSNIVWIAHDESQVLNKYLFYYYQIVTWNVAEGGTIQRLYNDNLKKIKIPIPPISEQQRIANILDKFETLINSISEELPREIELRKKQYEYYREKLLTFSSSES